MKFKIEGKHHESKKGHYIVEREHEKKKHNELVRLEKKLDKHMSLPAEKAHGQEAHPLPNMRKP
jgi:hypothetical protein